MDPKNSAARELATIVAQAKVFHQRRVELYAELRQDGWTHTAIAEIAGVSDIAIGQQLMAYGYDRAGNYID